MLPASLHRLVVVSPHCDDAVFSCGRLLTAHPGSVVVTLFAAGIGKDEPLPEWDQAAGFEPGDDVMERRRTEDARALAILACYPLWLPFHDSQYRRSPRIDEIRRSLDRVLHTIKPWHVLIPWGLYHSDHVLTSDVCLAVRRHYPHLGWFFYEDVMYRRIPGALESRIAEVRSYGVTARPISLPTCGQTALKTQAVRCYTSQLRALTSPGRPGYLDVFALERFWIIEQSSNVSEESHA